jgi:hypothetical protein
MCTILCGSVLDPLASTGQCSFSLCSFWRGEAIGNLPEKEQGDQLLVGKACACEPGGPVRQQVCCAVYRDTREKNSPTEPVCCVGQCLLARVRLQVPANCEGRLLKMSCRLQISCLIPRSVLNCASLPLVYTHRALVLRRQCCHTA